MAKQKLKRLPGATGGVNDAAAVRMVKLMRPICPNSKITVKLDAEGNKTVIPLPAGEINHQKGGKFGWWEKCEEAGHNPYFTVRQWSIPRPKVEVDPDTGEKIQTGVVYVLQEEERPNVAQVAINTRVNSGRGATQAIDRKGFRRLGDFGYEEVCQYRNCEDPIKVETAMGNYCSKIHAQLVAADAQGIALQNANFGYVGDPSNWIRKRQGQLREAGQAIESA